MIRVLLVGASLLYFVFGAPLLAQNHAGAKSPKVPSSAQVARGEYIVKGIAGCGDCHTPLDQKGEPIKDQWLQGSKLFFGPLIPIPMWTDTAPKIAGLEGWDTENAIRLLMTGLGPSGQPPRPPMPQFKMNRQDAAAVIAYLKSLK